MEIKHEAKPFTVCQRLALGKQLLGTLAFEGVEAARMQIEGDRNHLAEIEEMDMQVFPVNLFVRGRLRLQQRVVESIEHANN
jgi:hypothetical protein